MSYRLSLAELDCQSALDWLDLIELVIVLVAHDTLEPSRFVGLVLSTGRRRTAVFPYGPESLVKHMRILVVFRRLLGNFGEGVRLRDRDQLSAARDERAVNRRSHRDYGMGTHSDVSAQIRSNVSRWRRNSSGSG